MHRFLLAFYVLIVSSCSSDEYSACENMNDLANSPEKVEYVRTWLAQNLGKPEFRDLFGSHGWVYAIDDPRRFSELDLDLKWLQIDDRYGFIRLHGKAGPWSRYDEAEKVSSISIGEGRSGVLIFMSEFELPQEEFEADLLESLQPVSEGVFVFCR